MSRRATVISIILTAACGSPTRGTAPQDGAIAAGAAIEEPAARPAPPVAEPAPAPSHDVQAPDPEIRRLLLRADLVVVGTVSINACRGGCLGTVEVVEVVAGIVDGLPRELSFTTAPPAGGMTVEPVRVVAFLRHEPGQPRHWRLVLTGDRAVGLPEARARDVAASRPPPASDPAARAPFAGDLAALRAHDQSQWNGAPIVGPASRVFETLDFRGLSGDQVVALIGEPVGRDDSGPATWWAYTFHDGEQGVMPRLWFHADGTVGWVDLEYGQ